MYDLLEGETIGYLVPKKGITRFMYYHGNKAEVKRWVKSFGGNFNKDFVNIPFGALKYKGENVPVGYILKEESGDYIFTLELDLIKNYKF